MYLTVFDSTLRIAWVSGLLDGILASETLGKTAWETVGASATDAQRLRTLFRRCVKGEQVQYVTEWRKHATAFAVTLYPTALEYPIIAVAIPVPPSFAELPPRESEVLVLATQGKRPLAISQQLGISRSTVETYLRRCRVRLDMSRDEFDKFVASLFVLH